MTFERGDIVVYIKHNRSVTNRIGSVGVILEVGEIQHEPCVIDARWFYAADDSLETYNSKHLCFEVLEKVGHIDLPDPEVPRG